MFLPLELVRRALSELTELHPFFGITYLVCKRGELPVGSKTSFAINKEEEDFMRVHYRPEMKSKFYFQPFRTSSRVGRWLSHKYPSSGSQKTRTSGPLAGAFLHERKTDLWGWAENYIEVLRSKLD